MASKNTDEQDPEKKEDNGKPSCRTYDGPMNELMERTLFLERGMKLFLAGENNCVVTRTFRNWQSNYKNFRVRDTDIFLVSFPKTGSMWVQRLVWSLLYGVEAKKTVQRFPGLFNYFEADMAPLPGRRRNKLGRHPYIPGEMLRFLNRNTKRRLMKSHLPIEFLPREMITRKAKVLYVCRDPRDTRVSMYYQRKHHTNFSGSFNEFAEIFLADLGNLAPYWSHVLGFWKLRNEENILFIRYEELHQDMRSAIENAAVFLDQKVKKDEIPAIESWLSFSTMKDNAQREQKQTQVSYLRKGQAGDWKNHFDDVTTEKFKEWTENHLKDTDFPYYRDY